MPRDYYKILNVTPEATPEEIQRAYRALALRYHPDRNQSAVAATLMATINEAYEVLGEARKRSNYDRAHPKKEDRLGDAILLAARERLLKKNWIVVVDRQSEFVLQNDSRRVHVALVRSLDPETFLDWRRRASAFCVVLALRIAPPFNTTSNTIAAIDVIYSRLHGSFPDQTYESLFEEFLPA